MKAFMALDCVVVFHVPSVCIDANFSCLRDDWQLHLAGVNQLHICYCLQGKTH